MGSVPLMWGAWGAMLLVFIAFRVYVSRMSRNEDDQLVLQDSSDHLRREQEAMVIQLQKTKPLGRAILAMFAVVTLYVVGYYVMDVVHQFK
jgi:hypothetical protein